MSFSDEEFVDRYDDIRLVRTCSCHPEQPNAFLRERQVGHLRLRWGGFTVHYPDPMGELIYEAEVGDPLRGAFDDDRQRAHYLELAKTAIRERLARDAA